MVAKPRLLPQSRSRAFHRHRATEAPFVATAVSRRRLALLCPIQPPLCERYDS